MNEIHRINLKLGFVGTAIGAAIGSYLAVKENNPIFSGIGAVVGATIGVMIGFIFRKKTNIKVVIRLEKITIIILAICCLFITIASAILFILRRDIYGILGFFVFGTCGLFYLVKLKRMGGGDGNA